MQPALSPLSSVFSIGTLVHQLNKEAERRAGMSVVQWCVLNQMIRMPASSAQQISDAVRLHPSTLTQTLKRLARRNLIFVAQDPRDSRRKLISVTRQGMEAIESSRGEMSRIERDLQPISEKLRAVESHLSSTRISGKLPPRAFAEARV
jgi:DNA-binding MarR family transcriptional regulator